MSAFVRQAIVPAKDARQHLTEAAEALYRSSPNASRHVRRRDRSPAAEVWRQRFPTAAHGAHLPPPGLVGYCIAAQPPQTAVPPAGPSGNVLDPTIRAGSHRQAIAPSRNQGVEQQLQQEKN